MAHACNPTTLGGQGKRITWGQEFKTSLANMVKSCFYYKYKNISRVWCQVPVIPATLEAEIELLEPWGQKLQWAKIVPLHSSMGDRVRLCLKNNNHNNNKKNNVWGLWGQSPMEQSGNVDGSVGISYKEERIIGIFIWCAWNYKTAEHV